MWVKKCKRKFWRVKTLGLKLKESWPSPEKEPDSKSWTRASLPMGISEEKQSELGEVRATSIQDLLTWALGEVVVKLNLDTMMKADESRLRILIQGKEEHERCKQWGHGRVPGGLFPVTSSEVPSSLRHEVVVVKTRSSSRPIKRLLLLLLLLSKYCYSHL